MSHSVLQRMDAFSRQLVPCASIMAFTIIGVVPLHIPRFDSVAPSLPLIAVFYWTLNDFVAAGLQSRVTST